MSTLRLLFVCSRNQWRSPTAERVFARRPGVATRSAGTAQGARKRLSEADVEWADAIFAMESRHAKQLRADYAHLLGDRPLVVLDIPDDYRFMDPELVDMLETSVEAWLARWESDEG